jgi:hypothetical protein
MTRVGRTHAAVLVVGGLSILAMTGCGGGSDFKNKPRPPVPIQLTGSINDRAVSVQPDRVGAGPVSLLIANLSNQSHTVTIEGGPHNTTEEVGPINPQDTARIQETLEQGTYTVKAGSDAAASREIEPAEIRVGPPRKSSSGTVLLP